MLKGCNVVASSIFLCKIALKKVDSKLELSDQLNFENESIWKIGGSSETSKCPRQMF